MPKSPIITYNDIQLKRVKGKEGGKNDSDYDGFYEGKDDQGKAVKYFVKKPEDKVELLCELLAGRFIQKLKDRKLIDSISADLLICADVVKLKDGSYALIQPKVKFKELYHLTNTAYSDGSDRSPWYEILFGKNSYSEAIQSHKTLGVASMLFLSLLVGDQSVHSGNVIWQKKLGLYLFGRIDWGASWRRFCDPDNGVLTPKEYQGVSQYKKITKNYISNYTAIPGMLQKIGRHANKFSSKLEKHELSLESLFEEVLGDIPKDLITEEDHQPLADYLGVDVEDVCDPFSLNGDDSSSLLAAKLASVMQQRLTEIQAFKKYKSTPSDVNVREIPKDSVFSTSLSWLNQQLQGIHQDLLGDIEDEGMTCFLVINNDVIENLSHQFKDFLKALDVDVPDINDKNAGDILEKKIGKGELSQIVTAGLKVLQELREYHRKKELTLEQLGDKTQKIDDLIQYINDFFFKNGWPEGSYKQAINAFLRLPLAQRKENLNLFENKIKALGVLDGFQKRALIIVVQLKSPPLFIVDQIISNKKIAKGIVNLENFHDNKPKLRRRPFLLQYPAIVEALSTKKKLDNTTIDDLNALSAFTKDKLALNKGHKYKQAVHDFFVDSAKIRLSGQQNQQVKLKETAHKHFTHRDFGLRLLGDALLLISSFFGVGLIVGGIRHFAGKSFFFLGAETKTEKEVKEKFEYTL